jgi:hypothetical protein
VTSNNNKIMTFIFDEEIYNEPYQDFMCKNGAPNPFLKQT